MKLVCCPAPSLPDVCREWAPSHVLTLASPGKPGPGSFGGACQLHLAFNDVVEARPGLVLPRRGDLDRIIAFGRTWDRVAPLVVSCEAGVSRSTAALFAIACDRWPDMSEALIATCLREAAPCATPNPLLVSLADRILGRRGRMSQAVSAIGRGVDYIPYRAFVLPLP